MILLNIAVIILSLAVILLALSVIRICKSVYDPNGTQSRMNQKFG